MAPVSSIHCFGGEDEAVQPGLLSNPVEFDGIKIGVVEPLPDAEELNGVAVSQPVPNQVSPCARRSCTRAMSVREM